MERDRDVRLLELSWVSDVIESLEKDPFRDDSECKPGCPEDELRGYSCALNDMEAAIKERVFRIMAGVE